MIAGYLTTTEAANQLNVTRGRIRQLAATGRLLSRKLGPLTLLVKQSSVDKYKRERRRYSTKGKRPKAA
jgi:DNA binding domain, excisionase family